MIWSVFDSDELMALDDDSFAERLTEVTESRLGNVSRVSSRSHFPLRARQALNYVDTGVVIIGDAAHTIHPLAGQEQILGLQM